MLNHALRFIQRPEIESRKSCTTLLPGFTQQNAKILFNKECHEAFGLQRFIDTIDYISNGRFNFYPESPIDPIEDGFYDYLEQNLLDEIENICSREHFQDFNHFEKV